MSDVAIRDDSDALVLLGQAEQALALVEDSEAAEELWRRIAVVESASRLVRAHASTQLAAGRLKLRAERRWGELLGAAENTGVPVTAGNRLEGPDKMARHRARQVAAVPEDVFAAYIDKTTDPEMLRRGRLLRLAREAQPAAEGEAAAVYGDVEVRHGDLRSVLDDLADVDAVITDPPYPAEFLAEFDALGEVAARILKPDGLLVVMVGQTHLPEYLSRLSRHLAYRWCGAYLMEGPANRVFGRRVGTKWKPLLIFGGTEFITQDVFRSQGGDKTHHHWGQSESGMADIVERLTQPGQFVVDPFLGAGTTAVVCRDLGRRFVGCDVDRDAVAKTRARLADA